MITVTKQVISEIIEYMKQELPNEGCGYLGGVENSIMQFRTMHNTCASPKEFAFDAKEQFQAVREFRELEVGIIGVVHSHPAGKARLSIKDIEHADPNLFQLIVVPHTEEIAAFSVHADIVMTHEIVII